MPVGRETVLFGLAQEFGYYRKELVSNVRAFSQYLSRQLQYASGQRLSVTFIRALNCSRSSSPLFPHLPFQRVSLHISNQYLLRVVGPRYLCVFLCLSRASLHCLLSSWPLWGVVLLNNLSYCPLSSGSCLKALWWSGINSDLKIVEEWYRNKIHTKQKSKLKQTLGAMPTLLLLLFFYHINNQCSLKTSKSRKFQKWQLKIMVSILMF